MALSFMIDAVAVLIPFLTPVANPFIVDGGTGRREGSSGETAGPAVFRISSLLARRRSALLPGSNNAPTRCPRGSAMTVSLALLSLLCVPEAEPLPGTRPLTRTGDLAMEMVAGIDRYLER